MMDKQKYLCMHKCGGTEICTILFIISNKIDNDTFVSIHTIFISTESHFSRGPLRCLSKHWIGEPKSPKDNLELIY